MWPMKPTEPMPALEGAVHPSRVDQPGWFDRHPRVRTLIAMAPFVALTALMVKRLQTEGFSWLFAVTLVLVAARVGYHLAKIERPDAK